MKLKYAIGCTFAATLMASVSAASAQTTISVWGIDGTESYTYKFMSEFDEMRDDVVVEFRDIPFDALNEEYVRGFATNSAPDMLMINTTDTHFYAASDVLVDLTDRVAASETIDFDQIFPGYQAAVTYDDRIYQIPRGADTIMIYYNKDLIEAAGIDPNAEPQSWAELRGYAEKLTNAEGRVFGIAFSAKNNQEGPWQWLPFARMAGVDWQDINQPGAVRALELWTGFVEDGLASQEVLVWGQGDAAESFRSGRAAMVIQGNWDLGNMEEAGINYGLWKLPPEEEGGKRVSAAGNFTYGISKRSENVDVTFEMIEYMHAQSDRLWNEFNALAALPTTPENPKIEAGYNAFVEQLQYGQVLGPFDRWNDVSVALQTAIQSSLSGATKPSDALEKAAAEIEKLTQ